MYRKVHNRLHPIPIVIRTYDLPSCRGIVSLFHPVGGQPVIADIDNIHIVSYIQLSIYRWIG